MPKESDISDISFNNEREAFVYIIGSKKSGKKYSYVGWTYDIKNRLEAHNKGTGAKSTKGKYWKLLYFETFPNKFMAQSREWYLKRDHGFRAKIKQLHLT